jgi:hypothetical protein
LSKRSAWQVFPPQKAELKAFAGLARDEEGHEVKTTDGGGGKEENFWQAKALADARAAALQEASEARAQAAARNDA